jgi:hypothetical protein
VVAADAGDISNFSKRSRSEAVTGGQQQQQQQVDADSNAAAAAAAAAAAGGDGVPAAAAVSDANKQQQQQQQQQVFAGVRLCVWDHNHTQQAVKLAVRAGARLQAQLDAETTHVIAA